MPIASPGLYIVHYIIIADLLGGGQDTKRNGSRAHNNCKFAHLSARLTPAVVILVRCWITLGRAWASSKLHLECPHRHVAIRPARLLWLQGHGLSFTVEPRVSKGIHAMYERSCQARTWSQRTPCCPTVTQSSDSYHSWESTLLFVMPMHSTLFTLTLFHADPAVCQ